MSIVDQDVPKIYMYIYITHCTVTSCMSEFPAWTVNCSKWRSDNISFYYNCYCNLL